MAPRTDQDHPGIILRHQLRGHTAEVASLAWSPDGRLLVSADSVGTLRLWDLASLPAQGAPATFSTGAGTATKVAWSPDGSTLAFAAYGTGPIRRWSIGRWSELGSVSGVKNATSLAWSPDGRTLAAGLGTGEIRFWTGGRSAAQKVQSHSSIVFSIAWHPAGRVLASAGTDVGLWRWPRATCTKVIGGHAGDVFSVAWSPDGRKLVSASRDQTLQLWDMSERKQVLEGHTDAVSAAVFSPCGRVLVSRGRADGLRLWRRDTGAAIAHVDEPIANWTTATLAFHPQAPLLATASGNAIHIWSLDLELLLRATSKATSVQYTTAKVVLVGDSGVGKTGLGWRLAHGEFKEHASTHGQQFWMLDGLNTTRADGTECEAVLWDLAGQPDYRLLHALFVDDAELALVLFDPTDRTEPLRGAEYWLKALANRPSGPCPAILVGARTDRGQPTLTEDQILAFCTERGVTGGYLATSALAGVGLADLLARMRDQVAWDRMPSTVTTTTFKRIKEFVLALKEGEQVILDLDALRKRLQKTDATWEFTDDELVTAAGHLAKHGYIQFLRTAAGERRILLRPDLLNRLASSIVLEARRNPKGLGAVDEAALRSGQYRFPEMDRLAAWDQAVLLDAAVVLFLEHNLCFRETLGAQALLIFPELINRKRPATEGAALADDVSYTVKGVVANVYAALVVLLGYTNTFSRTEQWQAQAQYEVGPGEICGFRQIGEQEGEIDLVLSYATTVSSSTRLVFQGLFERILLGRQVRVTRYPALNCPECHYRQERSEVVRRTVEGRRFLFCSDCGTKIVIMPADELGLTAEASRAVDEQAATARWRTAYEAALAQLAGFVRTWEHERKRVFVSYAWGVTDHEQWVERMLALDLRHAGIQVVLDRWDNAHPGASVARFVGRITECDLIIVVGTPLYREKYENRLSSTGSVVAAEVDLINQRLLGTEEDKQTVLPILLDGEAPQSLPPLLRGRVYVDFRRPAAYFASLLDVVIAVHGVRFNDEAVIDLRQSLRQDSFGRTTTG
jgi:WD40 repeat protein